MSDSSEQEPSRPRDDSDTSADTPLVKRKLVLLGAASDFGLAQQLGTDYWVAWNRHSGQRVRLPGGPAVVWSIGEDAGSRMAFFAQACPDRDGEEESVWCIERFSHPAYKDTNGNISILLNGRTPPVPLAQALQKRRLFTFGIFVGPTSAQTNMDICIFELPSKGSRFWWRVEAIFEGSGLSRFLNRSANKWVHVNLKTWEGFFRRCGLGDIVRRSLQPRPAASEDLDAERCLNWVALPPSGMIALLCRLVFLPRWSGGFKDPQAGAAIRAFLQGVLDRFKSAFVITLYLDPWFKDATPDFFSSGAPWVSFAVSADLIVDLRGLRRLCADLSPAGGYDDAIHDMARILAEMIGSDDRLALVDFLQIVSSHETLWPLLGQVSVTCARVVEDALAAEEENLNEKRYGLSTVRGHLAPADVELASTAALSQRLADYRAAGLAACSTHHSLLSFASDGARMPTGKRLFGVVVLPTNVAIWWPPQAPPRPTEIGRQTQFRRPETRA